MDKLIELINQFILMNGISAVDLLCSKCQDLDCYVSPTTIRKVRNGHIPKPHTVYILAKASGASNKEATALGTEAFKK